MIVIGIDPGKSGGAVVIKGITVLGRMPFGKATEHDIADFIGKWYDAYPDMVAYLERVHSMPKQGVASSFKFGENYGFLQGVLTALLIRHELVTPQTWQRAMKCLSKGDKNVTKAAAQRLWPDIKWTHALADAALIAEYGRRTEGECSDDPNGLG